MHKIVNGQKVELSKEEANGFKKEWKDNIQKRADKLLRFEEVKKLRQDVKAKVMEKLDLTDKEMNVLFK